MHLDYIRVTLKFFMEKILGYFLAKINILDILESGYKYLHFIVSLL